MRLILVGEMWNAPHLRDKRVVAEDPTSHAIGQWSLPYALRTSAFMYGPSRSRLRSTGLEWNHALNLLPPMQKWDSVAAARMVDALGKYFDYDTIFIGLGAKVRSAFGRALSADVHDLYWFERWKAPEWMNMPNVWYVPWPHPSGRCREWNSPHIWQRARESARWMSQLRRAYADTQHD